MDIYVAIISIYLAGCIGVLITNIRNAIKISKIHFDSWCKTGRPDQKFYVGLTDIYTPHLFGTFIVNTTYYELKLYEVINWPFRVFIIIVSYLQLGVAKLITRKIRKKIEDYGIVKDIIE